MARGHAVFKQRALVPARLAVLLLTLTLVLAIYAGTIYVLFTRGNQGSRTVVARLVKEESETSSSHDAGDEEGGDNCIDLFIPYHISDHPVFVRNRGLGSILRHVKGWRKAFIVSAENTSLKSVLDEDQHVLWRSEESFSFSRGRQQAKLGNWYLQQALKLLAPLEMPEMCNTFLVLDADLHFVRDWSPQYDMKGVARWKYLFSHEFHGGHQEELAAAAQRSTLHIIGQESLTRASGTMCTVHHHMVMQKDVLRALVNHLHDLHGKPLLQIVTEAQERRWWVSEFDFYLSFVWHRFQERVQLVSFPYMHAREKERCTTHDAHALAQDTDVVFMACHDHYRGHDVCSGSYNNCTSSVSFCDTLASGACKAHDYTILPCHRPQDYRPRGAPRSKRRYERMVD